MKFQNYDAKKPVATRSNGIFCYEWKFLVNSMNEMHAIDVTHIDAWGMTHLYRYTNNYWIVPARHFNQRHYSSTEQRTRQLHIHTKTERQKPCTLIYSVTTHNLFKTFHSLNDSIITLIYSPEYLRFYKSIQYITPIFCNRSISTNKKCVFPEMSWWYLKNGAKCIFFRHIFGIRKSFYIRISVRDEYMNILVYLLLSLKLFINFFRWLMGEIMSTNLLIEKGYVIDLDLAVQICPYAHSLV